LPSGSHTGRTRYSLSEVMNTSRLPVSGSTATMPESAVPGWEIAQTIVLPSGDQAGSQSCSFIGPVASCFSSPDSNEWIVTRYSPGLGEFPVAKTIFLPSGENDTLCRCR